MHIKRKYLPLLLILIVALSSVIFFFCFNKAKTNLDKNDSALEQLRSLPYAAYSEDKADQTKKGVVLYNKDKAYEGYNLYHSTLIDMQGNEVYKWSHFSNFPRFVFDGRDILHKESLQKSISGIRKSEYHNLQREDFVWMKDFGLHHEKILVNNKILALVEEMHIYKSRKVQFDAIVELSQRGEELSRWSTWENFKYLKKLHKLSSLDVARDESNVSQDYDVRDRLRDKKEGKVYDYYHANSIQSLPETSLSKKNKCFRKGNWLVCMRNTNLVFIIDSKSKKIVWSYGPDILDGPHMPRMLNNGNILIYDNGRSRKYTRVIEVNPMNKEIVWEYKANPPKSFYSDGRGSAQRLPNGNTLIADADNGRAFEVTMESEIVWEWYNPDFNEDGKRRLIYRMIRYPKEYIDSILDVKYKKKSNSGRDVTSTLQIK